MAFVSSGKGGVAKAPTAAKKPAGARGGAAKGGAAKKQPVKQVETAPAAAAYQAPTAVMAAAEASKPTSSFGFSGGAGSDDEESDNEDGDHAPVNMDDAIHGGFSLDADLGSMDEHMEDHDVGDALASAKGGWDTSFQNAKGAKNSTMGGEGDSEWSAAASLAQQNQASQLAHAQRSKGVAAELAMQSEQRLTDAKVAGKQLVANREAELQQSAAEAAAKQKSEKEQMDAARERMRKEREAEEQTIDFDAQAEVMEGLGVGGGGGFSPGSGFSPGGDSPSSGK